MHNLPYETARNDAVVTWAAAGDPEDVSYNVIFRSAEDYTDVLCVESFKEYKTARSSVCMWGDYHAYLQKGY